MLRACTQVNVVVHPFVKKLTIFTHDRGGLGNDQWSDSVKGAYLHQQLKRVLLISFFFLAENNIIKILLTYNTRPLTVG